MSLVGSLDDLGLGEILQILSLSRKSGTLQLRSGQGQGAITFQNGEVLCAEVEGGATDLPDLLVRRGLLDRETSDRLLREARRTRTPLDVLLAGHALPVERLDEVRRRHVQEAVLTMFGWRAGEFSFESGSVLETHNGLALEPGLNAQFLALEGTRIQDERSAGHGIAEELPPASDPRRAAEVAATALPPVPEPEVALRAVVAISSQLGTLEAIKHGLRERFDFVHIFQRTDLAVGRIRQYLARGETPVVLLARDVPPDPLSGASGWRDLAARLKAQAAHMPVFLVAQEGMGGGPALPADGVLPHADRSPRLCEALSSILGAGARYPLAPESPADVRDPLRPASEGPGDPSERTVRARQG